MSGQELLRRFHERKAKDETLPRAACLAILEE